jgi:quercetin dioxygenase-like cupin family protein
MRFHLTESQGMPWLPSPFRGISHKFLRIGGDAERVVELTRIEKGAALPPHRHVIMQHTYFLSGRGEALDGKALEPGSYAEVPPGARHGTKAIEEVVLLNFWESAVSWFLDDGSVFVLRSDGSFADLGKVASFDAQSLDIGRHHPAA